MATKPVTRNIRVIKLHDYPKIIYIKHLGQEPYNEIKFDCGKKLIVSYSLSYWHSVFRNFERINKSVLINPNKIISEQGTAEVELIDNSKFLYSRRKLKNSNL
jgi:DNA-binding LytR/AlgR family response regulator